MDDLGTNRAHWDAAARLHRNDGSHAEAMIAGADSMLDAQSTALGDVSGLDVLAPQSHMAGDSMSRARRGARVTCVDLPSEAGHPADRRGVAQELVEVDAAPLDVLAREADGPRVSGGRLPIRFPRLARRPL